MSRIRKALVKPKRLKVVFDNPESVMQVQIARLCVLYEDLRIELAGSAEDVLYPLDLNAAQYRKMYFLRRSVATLLEVDSALHKLNSDPEFKDMKRTFDKERLRQWTQGIRYFAKIHKILKDERNMYGGHFQDEAAQFALQKLHPDHVGLVDISIDANEHTHNTKFRFALEFVGIGFTTRRGDSHPEPYINEAFAMLVEAMEHATTAVHVLEEVFILPRFGI